MTDDRQYTTILITDGKNSVTFRGTDDDGLVICNRCGGHGWSHGVGEGLINAMYQHAKVHKPKERS